ncbi:PSD1 and planctomycete cytochrome C domain-containing protein [Stieleria varia]|uniref:Planctomycete cytochrome C n=1 Tax=Stieleria varia TaxID=2528005 RepID=A0A5C6B1R6_9BACT|nr:PSD1 and planctomycete cytochrome C domain-containing protein [Stieleria varia]TWU04334.1 Planctomycete cytochrome C [Stieleria varia]
MNRPTNKTINKTLHYCFAIPFVFATLASVAFAQQDETVDADQLSFFETKIRPILVEHCYECHSADAEDVEAGLLLDSKPGWMTGGDSGPAIIPGDVDGSLIVDAVRYTENVVSAMPPSSKMSADKIAAIEQWVQMGAPDPRTEAKQHAATDAFDLRERFETHWSWRAPVRQELPSVRDSQWPTQPLDHFILSALESAKLRPATDADRRTWIRRVTFDLTGLPPTLAEIDAFVADESPQAYARVVDRLLDSKQFGEKWARHWMDLVRYAETYGHEFDYPIDHATEYRDYLIRAINADVPYDQFVLEHIAGDLIENPRRHPTDDFNESIIGTGFWYLHEATHAPTNVLQNEADIMANQIDVFGKAFLGLTIACAQCHDHKFDAISTADYYALTGYLHSSCRQLYPLDPHREIKNSANAIRQQLQQAGNAVTQSAASSNLSYDLPAYLEACKTLLSGESKPDSAAIDTLAKQQKLSAEHLTRWVDLLTKQHDADKKSPSAALAIASHLADSNQIAPLQKTQAAISKQWQEFKDTSTLFADFDSGALPSGWTTSGIAFQAVDQSLSFPTNKDAASFPMAGTVDSGVLGGRARGILRSPTFTITTPNIHIRMRSGPGQTVRLVIDNYQMAHFSALLFNGTIMKGKEADTDGQWAWRSISGDLKKYLGHNAYLEFIDESDRSIAVDQIWFSERGSPRASPEPLVDTLLQQDADVSQRWTQAIAALASGNRDDFVEWMLQQGVVTWSDLVPQATEPLAAAAKLAKQMPHPRYVVAMAQGSFEKPHIYIRGSHTNLGDELTPRFLTALGGENESRLEMAQRVVDPANPLTSRVFVNRLWHHLFGRGLVETVDDFGPQGRPPSHPKLLDQLALDFVDSGWSMKQAIRTMVLSRTYRQASVAHPELDSAIVSVADPTNRLLHRMSVRRLPAESIRDAILAISGRLDSRMFGPSVATHRTAYMTGRGARGSGPLDGDGRRSIYLSIYRNFLNPFLTTFDMPNPFGPKGRRSESNVPAQALALMNDPFVVEQAKLWSNRAIQQQSDERQRIIEMVGAAHGEIPTDGDIQRYLDFIEAQTGAYQGDRSKAWADFAHALWNMKAFYFLR